MDSRYLSYLAHANLNATEYKILLLVLTKPMTATQVARELGTIKKNKHKYFKKLQCMGFVEVERIEGRNKYYKAVTDTKRFIEVIPGQMKF